MTDSAERLITRLAKKATSSIGLAVGLAIAILLPAKYVTQALEPYRTVQAHEPGQIVAKDISALTDFRLRFTNYTSPNSLPNLKVYDLFEYNKVSREAERKIEHLINNDTLVFSKKYFINQDIMEPVRTGLLNGEPYFVTECRTDASRERCREELSSFLRSLEASNEKQVKIALDPIEGIPSAERILVHW